MFGKVDLFSRVFGPWKLTDFLSQPAIDVEAMVENGRLVVGVFAPEDMLGDDDVGMVFEGLKGLLQGLVGNE